MDNRPLILFDGVCNLCNGSVQFIIRHDPEEKFSFASLQSPIAKRLLNNFDVPSQAVYSIVLIKNGIIYDRSDAILEIAKDLNAPWSALRIFKFLPKGFRDSLYNLISKNRYRLFGRQDSCLMPTPDLRSRFIN